MSVSDPRTQAERRAAGDGEDVSAVEVRQATKTGHVRWILLVSLLLAVIVLGAIFLSYSSVQHGAPVVHHPAAIGAPLSS